MNPILVSCIKGGIVGLIMGWWNPFGRYNSFWKGIGAVTAASLVFNIAFDLTTYLLH